MILQSLHALYDRLVEDVDYAVAPAGYSLQKISFEVVLTQDGTLAQINDVRDRNGKKAVPVQRLVPGQAKPSGSGLNPGFLWDNAAYLLGYKLDDPKLSVDQNCHFRERATVSLAALRERHLQAETAIDDPGFSAVCRFLEQWHPEHAVEHPSLAELGAGFGVFRFQGETGYLHERGKVRAWWQEQELIGKDGAAQSGMCLITGAIGPLAQLHEPGIKGVGGAQSSGAKLVSFNCDAFTSYHKDKSWNSPVSESAAFRYCTVLNSLLSGPRSNKHRLTIGDATMVFWTERPTVTEDWFANFFSGDLPEESQDETALGQIQVLLRALREGGGALAALGDDPKTTFYLLGLAPNAARLSVRFWHVSTLRELFDRLHAHYDALRIVRQFEEGARRPDPEFPPTWMLLRETARETKDIQPLLGGTLMRAILTGGPYPNALASAVIRRIRADREINYCRAAILKAWLTRLPNQRQGAIPVSLDPDKPEPAYRLGRLFAVLEKTQQDALGDLNASIRDRFYSAASATPGMVFPRLLRTYQHHLAKLNPGAKINRERLVQDIVGGLDTMPAHLALEAQGLFAIGYYHQRKDLFTRTQPPTDTDHTPDETKG
ncbi:type I-C CRISPR-associated protein Cas8c/Csd1 [Thiocystis minor]|uniref:type I-C CRISPR-associated protein Cas8c/Csd1 n=1 Tax=Thiocystis minor TaxID=61597 RepID=UPI0019149F7A|nr:type I-C CRISPR-associated protein Cas8c/Csd1 [Thiocystis minor]MBK5966429.1 type I-C CRISPR-associated protein Cas8c/Csd1 [Thiocystis minor]